MRHQLFTRGKHRTTAATRDFPHLVRRSANGERGSTMKRAFALGLAVLAVVAIAAFAGRTQSASAKPAAGSLVGTGASFLFPLVSKWIPLVDNAHRIHVTYTATG